LISLIKQDWFKIISDNHQKAKYFGCGVVNNTVGSDC